MAGHCKFSELTEKITPARREKIDQQTRQMMAEMLLAEIRRLAGLTQVQVAESMGVSQSAMSQLETQDDMYISTLRRLVEALGGTLEIVANLPMGRISISQFKSVA